MLALFSYAWRSTLPVAFGYLPLGFAFGVLWNDLGYSWIYAGLFGFLVYAGAAQFMALGLLKAGATLFDFFSLTLMLNLRHIFYGVSFLELYKPLNPLNLYLIGGLTDETYSLLTASTPPKRDRRTFALIVSALNHLYWTVGCIAGAVVSKQLRFSAPELEFALPCLFIVLAIEQYRAKRRLDISLAAFASIILGLAVGGKMVLLIAISICLLALTVLGARKRWEL